MPVSRRALLLATVLTGVCGAEAAGGDEVTCPLADAPTTLIPGVSDAFATKLLGTKIYRGLLRLDADGAPQADLAVRYDVTADGLTHTFHLRPGIIWHDSGAFDAEDVIFSLTRFHRALQPALHLDRLKVEAPDPATVVVTLPAPDPRFLRRLDVTSLPIVPQHIHDIAGLGLNPRQTTPVGTGPFRFAEWLRLVSFPWYVGPKTSIVAIDCPIQPLAAARIAMAGSTPGILLAGDTVDYGSLAQLRGRLTLSVEADYPASQPAIAGIRLNLASPPLDNADVRQGLACAIDRDAALREVWAGLGRVATGPLPVGSPDRDPDSALPAYSPRTAAEHFNKAALRPDDDGIRAQLTLLLPPTEPWPALFSLLRRALGQVGIDLAAEPAGSDWAPRVAAGKYQLTGFTAGADLAFYGVADLPSDPKAAQAKLLDLMPAIWLLEPGVPVIRDRRLTLPGGVLGSFAEASLA